jgi:adenine/guanine phosphoribosyltransferase-like PRPP-binding protein
MTTIPVLHAARYLTQVDGLTWRDADWTAMKMVKGVKGKPIKGYFDVKFGDQQHRYDQNNVGAFVDKLSANAGAKLHNQLGGRKISIVPIPSSNAVTGVRGRSDELAEKVAAAYGPNAVVESVIRWKALRDPQHESSGYRYPDLYQDQMALTQLPKYEVVLFDDVMTSGSQLTAAARLLEESGHTPTHAMVLGRTTKEQEEQMVGWKEEQLPIGRDELDVSGVF